MLQLSLKLLVCGPLVSVKPILFQAIVLEGYYWKRRLDTITEEYKMSRKFFKRLVERRQEPEMSFLSDVGLTVKVTIVLSLYSFSCKTPGPGWSKLTMSLVNVLLKLQM